MWGEKNVLKKLLAEYSRLKKQDTLYALGELDDGNDGDVAKHHVAEGIAEEHIDLASQLELNDDVSRIIDKADVVDKQIMQMIMQGLSYDEISKKVGLSKGQISKRLKKQASSFDFEEVDA